MRGIVLKDFCDYIELVGGYGNTIAYKYFADGQIKTKSYKEIYNDAYGLASYFVKKGYSRAHIAILGSTSYNWVVSFIAILLSDNVAVPIDKMLPSKEQIYLLGAGDVDMVLYDEEFSETIGNAMESNNNLSEAFCLSSKEFLDLYSTDKVKMPEINPDELAEVLFTSGTTGSSKGVMISQTNIVSNIVDIYRMDYAGNYPGENVVMSVLPVHHTFELTVNNLGILAYGATICINDKLENIVDNMKLFQPTVMCVVPAIAEVFYKKIQEGTSDKKTARKIKSAGRVINVMDKFGIDSRRTMYKSLLDKFGGRLTNIVVGGAALRPEIVECFKNFGINMYQGYGLTECAPLVAACYPTCDRVGSVGQPVRYMDVKIENEEVLVKGPGVMLGYYKNPKATAEVMTEDGWFRTGDLGYIDGDGFLYLTGRSKNLIILDNGKNIYPEELEEKINHIDGVKESFVYGNGGRLCALILPETTGDKELRRKIEKNIKVLNEENPTYKKITGINFTSKEFPKTTTLKVKRHELMKRIAEQVEKNEVSYVAPTNPIEQRIVDAVEQVMSKKVGILDDFFEIGCDSLSAFEIAATLGVSAQDLYEYPTAQQMAIYLSGHEELEEKEEYVDVNKLILADANLRYNPSHKCVFLTGATGFLGAHILRELLKRKINVVCLVRNEERLRQTLGKYFPKEYQYFKYKVVKGDIVTPHFGLPDREYEILCSKVDTVIHTAANVHHAGHYEEFEKTNVIGTQNIIDFCFDADAVLHHTSTASVNGVGTVAITQGANMFDEFVLDIGQNYIQNVYIHSKYKAEERVLLARSKGLKANIYRIGNLTWRMSDGMFQKNAADNGFLGRAKGLLKARAFSPAIADFPLDFTAVDECADAYVRLVMYGRVNNIYHLYNPHIFTIESLTSKLFVTCKKVPEAMFNKLLREKIHDRDVAVLSFYSTIASNSRNVPVSCEYTKGVLEVNGFKWSKIGIRYLRYLKRFL